MRDQLFILFNTITAAYVLQSKISMLIFQGYKSIVVSLFWKNIYLPFFP